MEKTVEAQGPVDVTVRLRTRPTGDPHLHSLVHEAADEIERLRAAVAWVLGEAPDKNGKWFEPDDDEPRRPDGQPIARYWWRGNLRRMTKPNDESNRTPREAD